MKREHEDEMNYILGIYVSRAIGSALGGKSCPYPDKPFLQEMKEERIDGLTEEEKIAKTKQFFMALDIMGRNFNLSKDKEDGVDSEDVQETSEES